MRTPFDTTPRSDAATALDWMTDAACAEVGTDMFFPEKGGSTKPAKDVCRRCDVVAECLEYALSNSEEQGIYGGTSPQERRKLAKAAAA